LKVTLKFINRYRILYNVLLCCIRMHTVLLLNGSARTDGTTGKLAHEIAAAFDTTHWQPTVIHLAHYEFPFHGSVYADYDEMLHATEEVPKKTADLLRSIQHADAVVFLTPTYWVGRSQAMQGLVEYLTLLETGRSEKWSLYGKPAAVVATGNAGGSVSVVADLTCALNHIGMRIPPFCTLWFNRYLAPHTEDRWMEQIPLIISKELTAAVEQKQPKFSDVYE
jgi:multimeric flavodoxin WrbA